MMPRLPTLLACALVFGWPVVAQAFSDPAAFSASVLEAGGGGRFYTGSPAEGFGCDNCHSGGTAPRVQIEGMPARYVPRATYELRVSWSHELEHAAAALEVTDERGLGAGTLALPAMGTYLADESCEPKDAGLLAAQLYAADRERTIAASPDCGAFMLRVQWTAPMQDVGPVWIAGSVLESNHDGNFTGDGAQNFAQRIAAFGESKPDVVTSGGCSIAARSLSGGRALTPFLLIVALLAARRRLASASVGLLVGLSSLTVGCEVHESLWNQPTQVSVTRGSAVTAWIDAQVLELPSDASMDSGVDAAVPELDAAVQDAAPRDAAADLDAGPDMPDAMTPDAAAEEDDSGQRCTFRVTTLPLGGRYSPRNVGAIWIERSDGTFVKTLERWAGVRLRYLTGFRAANPTGNKVDAITSGTLSMFRKHVAGWNLADVEGREVADGDYRVQLEITDADKTGQMLTVPFKKTRPPFELTVADAEHFRDVKLRCR